MKYFVVKPKGDNPYAKASRVAIKAYAKSIEDENPQLCHDLCMWEIEEQGNVNRQKIDAQFAADEKG